jgi:hypothetical protein
MRHTLSGITGYIEATATDPTGNELVRIEDRWFMRSECEAV